MFGSKFVTSFVKGIDVDTKLRALIFLAHLDVSLRKAYMRLKRRIMSYNLLNPTNKESILFYFEHFTSVVESDVDGICAPKSGTYWWIYRKLTTLVHLFNSLKYVIVLIMLEGTLLPTEANCYLLGRMFSHGKMSEYLIVLATSMSFFILAWRYTLLLMKDTCLEMDIMVFLMHDHDTIEAESANLKKMNDGNMQRFEGEKLIFPQNALQRVLFYEFNCRTMNRLQYRLRPNRTDKCKKNLHSLLDKIVLLLMVLTMLFVVIVAPITITGFLTDASYIRAYPRCCPLLEELDLDGLLSPSRVSFEYCTTKKVSIIFDIVDNVIIFFDSYMVLILPLNLAALITSDLEAYWKEIDLKSRQLLEHLRIHNSLYPRSNSLYKSTGSFNHEQKQTESSLKTGDLLFSQLTSDDRSLIKRQLFEDSDKDVIENYVNELQSSLCDFFDCVNRADKLLNIILSYSMMLYIMATLLFGFFGWKIDGFYELTIVRFLFVMNIIIFIAGSSITLRLKRMIDRSYVDLCSITALDRSHMRLKWINILEFYTSGAKNSFTVFNSVDFTWMFVLNLVASSLSFLLAVATLKMQLDP